MSNYKNLEKNDNINEISYFYATVFLTDEGFDPGGG